MTGRLRCGAKRSAHDRRRWARVGERGQGEVTGTNAALKGGGSGGTRDGPTVFDHDLPPEPTS